MFDYTTPSSGFWAKSVDYDTWPKSVGRMQVELVALTTRRMLAMLEIPQAISRCQTPQDVIAEQVKYWQVAQRQYVQCLDRMSAMPKPLPTKTAPADLIEVAPTTASVQSKVVERPTVDVRMGDTRHDGPRVSIKAPAATKPDVRAAKREVEVDEEIAAWLYRKSA